MKQGQQTIFHDIIAMINKEKTIDRSVLYRSSINIYDADSSRAVIYHSIPDKSVVLDVGCASGDLGKILKENKKCTIFGLEYEVNSIAIALSTKAYNDVFQVDLNLFNAGDYHKFTGMFDVIVLGDVLEHLNYPERVLSELQFLLKPEGSFIISLPNIAHASIKMNLLLNNWEYGDVGILDRTHVKFFTYKTISAFMTNLGLSIQSMKYTVMSRQGLHSGKTWEHLPFMARQFIFKDPHSYIWQYILQVAKSTEGSELGLHNLGKMNITHNNMTNSMRKYMRKYRFLGRLGLINFV